MKAIVDEHYKPESRADCLLRIWRDHVTPVYPISLATFYRYMKTAVEHDGFIGLGQNMIITRKLPDNGKI